MSASRFAEIVAEYGPRAMSDLRLTAAQAAGLFGNGDVESGGFVKLQELKPLVKGSRGGYGWMQWTGPRRRAYEAYCADKGLRPSADDANYFFMLEELQGAENRALVELRRTKDVVAAANVVCTQYLRPGIPHRERRIASARRALAILAPGMAINAEQPRAHPMPEPVVTAPRVETVVPAVEKLPWWAALLGRKPKIVSRPGLKGDPALWDVQKALRDRNYYTKGFLDGLDGPLTQSAVAQARKDNGLGDGGVDDAFLRALPTMPLRPVSTERANIGLAGAAKHAPEVFSPLKWLASLGAGAVGLGGADTTGLLDNVQGTFVRINDTADKVQTGLGYVSSIVGFAVEHKGILLVVGGLYLVFWAGGKALDGWIKVRQAFF